MSGFLEQFLRYIANKTLDVGKVAHPQTLTKGAREAQIEQYRNPDKDVLPKQFLRPTSLSKFGDQEFRSMKQYMPDLVWMPSGVVGADVPTNPTPLEKIGAPALPTNLWSDPPDTRDLRKLGLGHYTTSVGRNDSGQPYLSVFDSWDFASSDPFLDYLIRDYANGKPFNVYDRIPFNARNGKMPAVISPNARLHDIELKGK